jgi:hypothetical protein
MKQLLFCLSLCLLLGACSDDDDNNAQPARLSAPSVVMGNGKANAWLDRDAQGNPTALGFTLSKGALHPLPSTRPATECMLSIPDEAVASTPFQHSMLDWNPQGHEPPGIYDVPHFDFHFYMMPMADVMKIPPYQVNPVGFDKNPAAAYLPAGYIKNPGGVPAMGAHWSDPTSAEFRGQPFTETFVYGSYNGQVTFIEPMVAMSYLKTSPNMDKEIKQPAQYEKPGYFPTRYSINTNADGSIDIALTQFVKR